MCCNRIRADDQIGAGRQRGHPSRHQGAQSALGAVAHDRTADGLGDNKTDPRRLSRTRVGLVGVDHDQRGASSGSPGPPEGGREVRARTEPVPRGQHGVGLRRRARSGPWRGGPTGWRDPHGCASAGGSRGSWPDDGCSAGKYACSRGSPLLVRPGWPAECLGGWSAAIGGPRQERRWSHRRSRGVTGMRKRPTGLVKGTRARRAGSNSRRPPGIPAALAPVRPAGGGDTPRCRAQFGRARPIFGRFGCRVAAAVVTVPPRPIPFPQVVDNRVDKACCGRTRGPRARAADQHRPCDRAAQQRPSKGMWTGE